MASLNSGTAAKQLIYQSDAINNIQESPGASSVLPADGSLNTATPGNTGGITTIPQPGQGYPLGQDATSHPGTYPKLVDPTIQQSTDTVANTTGTSQGLVCDSTVGVKSGNNSLQNDTSAMANGNAPSPTYATGVSAAAGLSQAPQTE